MGDIFEYLCIDDFLSSFIHTQAIKGALDTGLIDLLLEQPTDIDGLESISHGDWSGIQYLLDILVLNNVIACDAGCYRLSDQFMVALKYRDLLEMKIEFSNLMSSDVMNHISDYFTDMSKFMHESRLFELFDYHQCYEATEENTRRTREWMKFTTAYTRYESQACMHRHDFSQYRRLLDIGGNSGEFALQLCKKNPNLYATIADLPVVCDIGQEHVASQPESDRIEFIKKNVLEEELPGDFDIVSLKSLLHDWPEEAGAEFIRQAWRSLKPGGKILIFERGKPSITTKTLGYSMLPIFLFARFFRETGTYSQQLSDTGFTDIHWETIELDMPFILGVATRPY